MTGFSLEQASNHPLLQYHSGRNDGQGKDFWRQFGMEEGTQRVKASTLEANLQHLYSGSFDDGYSSDTDESGLFKQFYSGEAHDLTKKFKDKAKSDVNETVSALLDKRISDAVPLLEKLYVLLNSSRRKVFWGEIIETLILTNIGDIFAKQIKAVFQPQMHKDAWKIVRPIYKITFELASTAQGKDMFSAHLLSTPFVEETVGFLNHPTAESELKRKLESDHILACRECVKHALETLLNIVTGPLGLPSKSKESIQMAAQRYSASEDNQIAEIAEKLRVTVTLMLADKLKTSIQVTIKGRMPSTAKLHDPDEMIAEALCNSLLSWTKKEKFVDVLLTDKLHQEWQDIWSTIEALAVLSRGNTKLITNLCRLNIVSIVNGIFSENLVMTDYGKTQKVSAVIDRLLILLVNISLLQSKRKYFCVDGFQKVCWRILNGHSDNNIRCKALILLARYPYHKKKGVAPSILEFKASLENAYVVSHLGNLGKSPEVVKYLLSSGFIDSAGEEISGLLSDGPIERTEDQRNHQRNHLMYVMSALLIPTIHSQDVVDVLMKYDFDKHLKLLLLRDISPQKRNHTEEQRLLTSHVVVLFVALGLHGYCNEIVDEDGEMVRLLHKWATKDEYTNLKFWALTFFVIMPRSIALKYGIQKLPSIIGKKNTIGALEFLEAFRDQFLNSDRKDRAGIALADYLSEDDPLHFITGDLKSVVNANPTRLQEMIGEMMNKFNLLRNISMYISFSENLSAVFLRPDTQLVRFFLQLLSNDKVVQCYKSKDDKLLKLLQDVLLIMLQLAEFKSACEIFAEKKVLQHVLSILKKQEGYDVFVPGLMWQFMAKVWYTSGCSWPPQYGIAKEDITDAVGIQHGLSHLTWAIFSAGIPGYILNMQDCPTLVTKICRVIMSMPSKVDDSTMLRIFLTYTLCVFSIYSAKFSVEVVKCPLFKALIEDTCILKTDISSEVSVDLVRMGLYLLNITARQEENIDILSDQFYLDILKKYLASEEPMYYYLVMCTLAKFPKQESVSKAISQIQWRESISSYLINPLRNFAVFEETSIYRYAYEILHPDTFLSCLELLAREEKNKTPILHSFNDFCLGDILELSLLGILNGKTTQNTIRLSWFLAMDRSNAEVLREDDVLMSTLREFSSDKHSDLYRLANWSLLEITEELPCDTDSGQGRFDIAIVSTKNTAGALAITSSLRNEGYEVTSIELEASCDPDPSDVVNAIHASRFIIFLFNGQSKYLTHCRTVMNYAQKIGKPYIGVFVGASDMNSWEQSRISPQDKVYIPEVNQHGVGKVIFTLKQQLPKQTVKITDRQPNTAVVHDFNKFSSQCAVCELYDKGNFVGSVFDDKGGYLKIPSMGVVLYIPPDAIEEGRRQPIYCHVNEYKYGEINAGKVVLTPVVHCGPDEASFKKNVVLSFPHSAVDADSWDFNAITKPTSKKWKDLPDSTLLVKGGSVFLFLDHFTGYAAEAAAKEGQNAQRRIIVGLGGQFLGTRGCEVSVGAWNDVETSEKPRRTQTPGDGDWRKLRPVIVSHQDTKLKIELSDIDEGWKLRRNNSVKCMALNSLGSSQDSVPLNTEFVLKYDNSSPDDKPEDLSCSVLISLDASDYTDTVDLFIDRHEKKAGYPEPNPKDSEANKDMTNADRFITWKEDWKPCGYQIRQLTWRKLCLHLDIKRDELTDWRGFAAELKLGVAISQKLDQLESPGRELLAFYFIDLAADRSIEEALSELEIIFHKMKNHILCAIIRDELKSRQKVQVCDADTGGPIMEGSEDSKENINPTPPCTTRSQ